MANPEHVDILKQGVEVWNKWRKQNPKTIPDLGGADFSDTDLRYANLNHADLVNVDFGGADLSDANLSYANLYGAFLHGTYFTEADLSHAKIHSHIGETIFTKAILISADFSNIELDGADFTDADLTRADLSSALLSSSVYTRTNFTDAKLNGCKANVEKTEFIGAIFIRADLSDAKLKLADFTGVDLTQAELSGADLRGANFTNANLSYAYFSEANLARANLTRANLTHTGFFNANLANANLSYATLVSTDLTKTVLSNCIIYGISAWDVQLKGAKQDNLTITPPHEPTITVDNLKIAQFIYLLLNNSEIRDVIDTIAKKAVLILGRFTSERKAVLDALKQALRTHDYLPILFDFDKPSSQDLTETVSTLAHLARFIIVDLSDPSSAPYEISTIAPNHIRPIQALFHPTPETKRVFAMYPDLIRRYHWVLPPFEYEDLEHLLASLQSKVIEPAEQKAQELAKR